MDLLWRNRFNSLAPPQGMENPGEVGGDVTNQNNPLLGLMPDHITSRFENLAATPTPLSDEYTKQLMNPPNENDYKPSLGRKIMAGIAGFSGTPGIRQHVLDEPYDHAKQDYYQRVNELGKGALQEERMISNKRGIAAAETQGELRSQANDINQQRANDAELKSQEIFKTKMADMQRKEDEFNQTIQRLQSEFQAKQGNVEAQLKLREQAMEITRQRMELANEMKDKQLEEVKRLHDLEKQRWENQNKNAEERNKLQSDYIRDKNAGKDVTTSYITDENGNVTGRRTVTTPLASGKKTRQDAIDFLKKNNKIVNEDSIALALKNIQ